VDLTVEWSGRKRFCDLDTLVAFLAKIPWAVDGFSVRTHADTLLRLHHERAPLVFTQHRYLLRASRPR
jgi:hypothetical protein